MAIKIECDRCGITDVVRDLTSPIPSGWFPLPEIRGGRDQTPIPAGVFCNGCFRSLAQWRHNAPTKDPIPSRHGCL